MKLKLYLRMVLAVMTALFTMTGCNSSNEEPVVPEDVPLTFQLEVSAVGSRNAAVAVKPSNEIATYYCGAMEKSVFDAFATEADFLAAEIKQLQGLATQQKMTLKAYLEMYASRGEGTRTVTTKTADTEHYAYVYGIKTDGTVSSKVFKSEVFTSKGSNLTLSIDISKITFSTMTMSVTPSDKTIPYIFGIMTETEYEELGGTPAVAVPAYLSDLFEFLQTLYPEGKPLSEIVALASSLGDDSYDYDELTPDMKYYTFAVPIDTEGITTGIATIKEFNTLPEGDGPIVTVTVAPGAYPSGGDPTTQVYLIIESDPKNVTAGKYYFNETSIVDEAIASGETYESLVAGYGDDCEPEDIGMINDNGLVLTLPAGACKPGTSYTAIALLSNATGTSEGHGAASTTTGGGGEPTDAYKAWLGTWTVTSTKNEVDNTPVSFDVTLSQKAANSTYKVIGWGISGNRLVDMVAMTFNFDSATGGFIAKNGVVIVNNFETPDKLPGTIEQTINYLDPNDNKYYLQPGDLTALLGTMKADKQSADVVGAPFTFKGDPTTYTVTSLDLAMWSSTYEKVWGWKPAAGFTNTPVGPYTMTKKSGAPAPAKSMAVGSLNGLLQKNMNAAQTKLGKVLVAPNVLSMSSILNASTMCANARAFEKTSGKMDLNAASAVKAKFAAFRRAK